MSRFDLLPPNATQLERDFSRVVSSLQRVGPPVPVIRTAKRVGIPDSVVPWLIYEYGLGEILPYLGNDQRLALRDGILWQRIRGTPESVRVALGWIGIEGLIEEPEGGTDRWAEYMLGLDAATEGDEIIDRIVAITRISSPVRSRLQRIYAVYDFRRAVWGEFAWGDGSIYSDHSGVRPRPDWPQISYGRKHSGIVTWDGATFAASTLTKLAGLSRLIDIWRWGEDAWGEGWHVPNREPLVTTTRGISSSYEGQNWGPFQWREEKWGDVNVVVSSNNLPPLTVNSVVITGSSSSLVAGGIVTVTVNLSGPAIVVTTGGTPSFAIDIGAVTRNAAYASGSGTSALVFTYTVVLADEDDAGGITAAANALSLNGGTISNPAGMNIITTTPAVPPGSNSITVNGGEQPSGVTLVATRSEVLATDIVDWNPANPTVPAATNNGSINTIINTITAKGQVTPFTIQSSNSVPVAVSAYGSNLEQYAEDELDEGAVLQAIRLSPGTVLGFNTLYSTMGQAYPLNDINRGILYPRGWTLSFPVGIGAIGMDVRGNPLLVGDSVVSIEAFDATGNTLGSFNRSFQSGSPNASFTFVGVQAGSVAIRKVAVGFISQPPIPGDPDGTPSGPTINNVSFRLFP